MGRRWAVKAFLKLNGPGWSPGRLALERLLAQPRVLTRNARGRTAGERLSGCV